MRTARSKNGATIRLPDERWVHITEEHSELAGYLHDVLETIEEPSVIYAGIKPNCSRPGRSRAGSFSS